METLNRPQPPQRLLDSPPGLFLPAHELAEWIREAILEPDGPLFNADHEHLTDAQIGVLWTNQECRKGMGQVVGMAEMPSVQGNAWLRGRMEQQLRGWFGEVPTFLLTFDAAYAAEATGATFCALVEHELYHCAQRVDRDGNLVFNNDGAPVFGMRRHDCEEFVGVVRRYGAGNAAGGTAQLVAAAVRPPLIAAAEIAQACGTCRR